MRSVKGTVGCSFTDAKQRHGHRYARMRGLRKVAKQCLLATAAQNIKKIALLLAHLRGRLRRLRRSHSPLRGLLAGFAGLFDQIAPYRTNSLAA